MSENASTTEVMTIMGLLLFSAVVEKFDCTPSGGACIGWVDNCAGVSVARKDIICLVNLHGAYSPANDRR